jgi:hypothetical protein
MMGGWILYLVSTTAYSSTSSQHVSTISGKAEFASKFRNLLLPGLAVRGLLGLTYDTILVLMCASS